MAEASVLGEKIRAVLPDVRELRHQLHQIPEIAFKEYKTSARIREYLEGLGLPLLPTTLGTDVTAVLKGGRKRKGCEHGCNRCCRIGAPCKGRIP